MLNKQDFVKLLNTKIILYVENIGNVYGTITEVTDNYIKIENKPTYKVYSLNRVIGYELE